MPHVRLRLWPVRAESGLRQHDLDRCRSLELIAMLGMKSDKQYEFTQRRLCLPRKLEAIAETAERLLPSGMCLRGIECPQTNPLLIRRLRTIEQLAFDVAGNLDWLFVAVDWRKDERDLIVSRFSIAIEAAGEQRVDLQTSHLKLPLVEIKRLFVAGRLDEFLLQRFVQATSRREFRSGSIDLHVQRTKLVLLIAQPSFQQIDITSMRTARSGNDGQQKNVRSEPHP